MLTAASITKPGGVWSRHLILRMRFAEPRPTILAPTRLTWEPPKTEGRRPPIYASRK